MYIYGRLCCCCFITALSLASVGARRFARDVINSKTVVVRLEIRTRTCCLMKTDYLQHQDINSSTNTKEQRTSALTDHHHHPSVSSLFDPSSILSTSCRSSFSPSPCFILRPFTFTIFGSHRCCLSYDNETYSNLPHWPHPESPPLSDPPLSPTTSLVAVGPTTSVSSSCPSSCCRRLSDGTTTASSLHGDCYPPPVAPIQPAPDECCGGGCCPCILDIYYQELEEYQEKLAAWQALTESVKQQRHSDSNNNKQ
eukprot:GHVS01018478.1.p1 GENE.GHVS01018478.1~~GHVS01018478.1.p1  ORF type:complete len:254 (-),score=47.62 GHVS01018478.1:198-959(-)